MNSIKFKYVRFKRTTLLSAFSALLFFYTSDVFAYSGAGGECIDVANTSIGRDAIEGKATNMQKLLEEAINKKWLNIRIEARDLIQTSPIAMKHWRNEARNFILSRPWGCVRGSLLDYAVANGNIDVTQWLLDEGVDPSGDLSRNKSEIDTIFTRCGYLMGQKRKANILSNEALRRKVQEAYKMLIERGGDINKSLYDGKLTVRSYLTECKDREMVDFFTKLGRLTRVVPTPSKNKEAGTLNNSVETLTGRSALERAVFEGGLLRADSGTFLRWFDKYLQRPWYRKRKKIQVPEFWDAYLLLPDETFNFPSGLIGNQAPTFFVLEPSDWRSPQEKITGAGESTVYYFRNGECVGRKC